MVSIQRPVGLLEVFQGVLSTRLLDMRNKINGALPGLVDEVVSPDVPSGKRENQLIVQTDAGQRMKRLAQLSTALGALTPDDKAEFNQHYALSPEEIESICKRLSLAEQQRTKGVHLALVNPEEPKPVSINSEQFIG